MRYLPLTPQDREAMLATIGAASIDDLFCDVPEAARLDGPVDLPSHARRNGGGKTNEPPGRCKTTPPAKGHAFWAPALTATMCRPVWIT